MSDDLQDEYRAAARGGGLSIEGFITAFESLSAKVYSDMGAGPIIAFQINFNTWLGLRSQLRHGGGGTTINLEWPEPPEDGEVIKLLAHALISVGAKPAGDDENSVDGIIGWARRMVREGTTKL